jgi:hypothetical protein
MAWETVVYFGMTLLIEWLLTFPFITSLLMVVHDPGVKDEVEDDDVAQERQRVASGGADNETVKLDSLRKVYPSSMGPKVAVQSLSFGIAKCVVPLYNCALCCRPRDTYPCLQGRVLRLPWHQWCRKDHNVEYPFRRISSNVRQSLYRR